MFEIEKEVPSVELCKKLKELGYPQTSGGWYWRYRLPQKWELTFFYTGERGAIPFEEYIKAPTCREMGEFFPPMIDTVRLPLDYPQYAGKFCCLRKGKIETVADTEAEARAKMLIWLVENGYVKFQNKKIEELKEKLKRKEEGK